MSTRLERRTVNKAASYTINPNSDAPGTVFTNVGATGAITFTLPAASRKLLGWWYRFKGIADQDIVVAVPTVDTAVSKNDAAADSLAASTSGEKIGSEIEAQCLKTADGTYQWALAGLAVGHTYTVAT